MSLVLIAIPCRADDMADQELADLLKRVEAPSGDRDKLRADLLRFVRRDYPGTRHAVRAAELLSTLPSPLDKLDPANIPELERFDWFHKELVAVLGESRGRQAGTVGAVAYSPDGKLLLSGGSNGLVRLWDPATLKLKTSLGTSHSITSIIFSRDGKTTAAANTIGQVYFWDLTGDKPKAGPIIRAATTSVNSLSLSPNAKLLATGSSDFIVRVFDMTTEKEPKEKIQLIGHTGSVNGVAYSPDGKSLISVSSDMSIRTWEPGGGQAAALSVLDGAHKAAITCMAFSPADAKMMATGCADGSIKLWDMGGAKPKERSEATTKAGYVYAVTFTPAGKTLASAHADGSVHFWDIGVNPPKERFVVEGHSSSVLSLAISPNGAEMATGCKDWVVRTWNLGVTPKPKQRAEPRGHLSHVYASAFSPDDTTLATGSYDQAVRMWSVTGTAAKEKATLTSEDKAPIYALAWSPDGKILVSGGASTNIRVWNALKMDKLRQLNPNPGHVVGLAFSPDNKTVLAAASNTVVLWDANTTDELGILSGHEATVHCVAVSPDGKRAVTGAGKVKVDEAGRAVIIDGKTIFEDPVLRVFDLKENKILHSMKSHLWSVGGVAFAPDGSRVLSFSSEGIIRQLDLSGQEPMESDPFLKAAPYTIRQVVFSPDGKKVATMGPDASVVVMDAATGKALQKWSLPESIGHVSWSGDSRHLGIAAATGVIYLYRLGGPTK
jgi:WD40 repeat protein